MFFNETDDIAKKVIAREAQKSSRILVKPKTARQRSVQILQRQHKGKDKDVELAVPITWRSRLISKEVQSWGKIPSIPPSIAEAVEVHAIAFFLQHYVQSNHDHTRGQFEYLPSLCNQAGIDRFFSLAISAVGLAGLANTVHSLDLLNQAKTRYHQAVAMTTFALGDPDLSRRDTTILSVMLLGMFESVTFEDRESMKSWDIHVAGTATIIIMRGFAQFDTALGIRIFQQFHNHYLFHCVRHRKPAAEEIKNLRDFAAGLHDPSSPEWRLSEISTRWVDHIAGLSTLSGPMGGNSNMVAATSAKLDQELLQLSREMTGVWSYDTVQVGPEEGTDLVFHGYYHIYHEPWMAQVWNSLRGIRILLNELLSGLLVRVIHGFPSGQPVPAALRKKLQDCVSTQRVLTADICASIPQHLGQITGRATRNMFRFPDSASVSLECATPVEVNSNPIIAHHTRRRCSSASTNPKMSGRTPPAEAYLTDSLPLTPASLHISPRCSPREPPPPKIFAVPFVYDAVKSKIGRGVNFLLWPLFVCGNIKTTSWEERKWLITRLEIVGKVNGNCQAKILATMLRDDNAGQGFRP